MKWFVLILSLASLPVQADTCRCDVYAVAPLTASQKIEPFTIGSISASYYGDLKPESQTACREECRLSAMNEYTAQNLREQLLPWTNDLIADGLAGYNCTGPTDFKIPVRVRANIGKKSLGLVHETMVFLHREKSCF